MADDTFQKLTEVFRKFPGIGPRQANRFVFFLAGLSKDNIDQLKNLLTDLTNTTFRCPDCRRLFSSQAGGHLCRLCADPARDQSHLIIVEKESDLDNLEKTGIFKGRYFVLGKLLPLFATQPEQELSLEILKKKIKKDKVKEITIALSANLDGDSTANFIKNYLIKHFTNQIKINFLGRGLSSGTELEYSDPETLKNAWENRK